MSELARALGSGRARLRRALPPVITEPTPARLLDEIAAGDQGLNGNDRHSAEETDEGKSRRVGEKTHDKEDDGDRQ